MGFKTKSYIAAALFFSLVWGGVLSATTYDFLSTTDNSNVVLTLSPSIIDNSTPGIDNMSFEINSVDVLVATQAFVTPGGEDFRPDTLYPWSTSTSTGQWSIGGNGGETFTDSGSGIPNFQNASGSYEFATPGLNVPEPSTYLILSSSLLMAGLIAKRRSRKYLHSFAN